MLWLALESLCTQKDDAGTSPAEQYRTHNAADRRNDMTQQTHRVGVVEKRSDKHDTGKSDRTSDGDQRVEQAGALTSCANVAAGGYGDGRRSGETKGSGKICGTGLVAPQVKKEPQCQPGQDGNGKAQFNACSTDVRVGAWHEVTQLKKNQPERQVNEQLRILNMFSGYPTDSALSGDKAKYDIACGAR